MDRPAGACPTAWTSLTWAVVYIHLYLYLYLSIYI